MTGKFGVILCVVLMVSTAPLYGDVNILTNPGFEDGSTAGWAARAGGTIAVAASPVRTGTYCGQSSNRNQTYQGIKQSILGKLNVGQTCTISGYVQISTAGDTVKLTVEKQEAGVTTYQSIKSATAGNTDWTLLSGSYTLSATGAVTVLDIYFEGPVAGVVIYVDDAQVLVPQSIVSTTGQINPATRYQSIEGFGAAGAWYGGWLTAHPQKATLYNLLFRDLSLDIYRIRNTWQIDSDSMNTDDTIITAAQAALGRPLKVMISSWSPPADLKSSGATSGGTLAKDGSGNYRYADFAQWWLDSLNAYAALGITAEYVNMQNEPDYLDTWDTCKFTPAQTTDYAGYNQAFAALANLAGSMPGSPKLLAPEAIGIETSQNFINALLDRTPVYAYAHHLYADGNGNNPDGYITDMTNYAANYNDKPRMQTEFSNTGDTGEFSDAINLALLMHNSLTYESVSAYVYWDLFWGTSGGLITLTNPWQANPTYIINPVYWAFKHYSAYIDAGWRRVAASTDASGLRISAYASPDNHAMTVVIINPSATTAYNLTFTPNQFEFTSGQIYRSTATENAVPVGSYTPTTAITVAVSSIVTITMTGTITPSNCTQVMDLGYRLSADLNGDCAVDLSDLMLVVNQWLSADPAAIALNHSPDLVADNTVNLADFEQIAGLWLVCNIPAGSGCIENW